VNLWQKKIRIVIEEVMHKYLILIIFAAHSFCSFSQTWWKVENEFGDEILLTIEINREKNTFVAFTRKDALKDIAGTFTYTLAKTAGKLKYPEIVFIEGTTQNKKDSIHLTGTFTYFDKQFPYSGTIRGNNLKGSYIDRNRPRTLKGTKLPDNKPIKDYPSLINSAFSIAEKNMADPGWLKSGEWIEFKKKINELKPKIADDYELAAAIEWNGKKLPFSPFVINKTNPNSKPSENRNRTAIRELSSTAALFDINTLPGTKHETDSIAEVISKKGYQNLVVDLRGRNSITPCAANHFLNLVAEKSSVAGFYLTRKWFSGNTSIPKAPEYSKIFKSFAETCPTPNEFYKEPGQTLTISPIKKGFKGKVYIITDNRTSKVSEALVYILKSEKRATIVGQKTVGTAFMVEQLPINKQFKLNLPVAEFYSADGKKPLKEGIQPDVTVTGEDALKYIQKNLIK
jgi:hypothetical protein